MSLIFAESETTSLTLVDFDDTTPGDDPVIGTVGEAIEASKTRARSGKYLSSLSELVTLLAELGANGPSHLQNVNISDIGIQVGHGNQFDVFRQVDHGPGHSLQNVVYKRVKLRPKRTDSDYAVDRKYRGTLRYLQLEVISLCHPRLRNHRNIVKLLSWACNSMPSFKTYRSD